MRIIHCTQYSAEWWAARQGLPTASQFSRIITPGGKPSAQAAAYAAELIADLYDPHYPASKGHGESEAMRNGRATEPEARAWYELDHEIAVSQVGFVLNDAGTFGFSPDGLILEAHQPRWGLEIKCPTLKVHTAYCLGGILPADHRPQVHSSMAASELPWWDFLSYPVPFTPRIPPFRVRVWPDEYTELCRAAMATFNELLTRTKETILKGNHEPDHRVTSNPGSRHGQPV